MTLPLSGKRVLVLRAVHQAGRLTEGLRLLGAEPVELPLLQIGPPDSFTDLDRAVAEINSYQWLILTSANAVDAVRKRAELAGVNLSILPGLQVAAIGSATADAARAAGLKVDVMPEAYVAEELAAVLRDRVADKRVLLARAAVARDVIPEELAKAGADVTVVEAYRTDVPEGLEGRLRSAVEAGLDAVAFTSSSSVRNLARVAREARVGFPLAGPDGNVPGISIGPVTSATMRERGWEPAREAAVSDIPRLIEAIMQEMLQDRVQGFRNG